MPRSIDTLTLADARSIIAAGEAKEAPAIAAILASYGVPQPKEQ